MVCCDCHLPLHEQMFCLRRDCTYTHDETEMRKIIIIFSIFLFYVVENMYIYMYQLASQHTLLSSRGFVIVTPLIPAVFAVVLCYSQPEIRTTCDCHSS